MTRESPGDSVERAVEAERTAHTITMITPILAAITASMAVAFAVLPGGQRSAFYVGGFAVVAVLVYAVNRRGHNGLAAAILVPLMVIAPVLEPLATKDPSTNIAFIGISGVLALMLTEWRHRWWVLGAVAAVGLLAIGISDPDLTAPVGRSAVAISGTGLLIMSLVTGLWLLENYRTMIERAADAQRLAESKSRELAEINEGLAAAITEREAQLVEAIAAQRHLAERLSESAVRDPLTGLLNRRYLDQLSVEHPAAVALLDVDHFKVFNDTYSYEVGDEVLRGIAATLSQQVRPPAVLTRYGGEEFAVVFPAGSKEDVTRQADHLRKAVAQMPWDHLRPGLEVTVSVGLCICGDDEGESHGGRTAGMLRCADAALSRAKGQGRNRTSISSCHDG